MWNPLSWVMDVAAVMAIAQANGGLSIHKHVHKQSKVEAGLGICVHAQQYKDIVVSYFHNEDLLDSIK